MTPIETQEPEKASKTQEPEKASVLMKVMDKDSGEVVTIDASKEKDWKKKYLHRSGEAFE